MATKVVSKNKDFVSIPRDLYEEFLVWEKTKSAKTFTPTAAEKRALARGRRNFAKGNYITLKQLKHELGIDSRKNEGREGNMEKKGRFLQNSL